MRWIAEASLDNRFVVAALAMAIVAIGVVQLPKMPVDVLPEFGPPYVEIQTEALGLSADEVESLITVPLEEFLSGTPWLRTLRSESASGLSSVMLIFEAGTDMERARQFVQERLVLAHKLPDVAKTPTMLQPLSATSRVMVIGVSSNEISRAGRSARQ
jgi:Cu/Ag efflux pump CusA